MSSAPNPDPTTKDLNDRATRDALDSLTRAAARLNDAQVVEPLTDALILLGQFGTLVSDEMVSGAGASLGVLLESVAALRSPAVQTLIARIGAVALEDELIVHPRPVKGIFALLRALRDPATQRGLGAVLALAAKLGATEDSPTASH